MAKKEIEIRGTPGLNPPAFSDAVHVSIMVRQTKGVKTTERAGNLRLTFLDTVRQQVISEIVLDHLHAKDLLKVLSANVKALDMAVKKGKLPKQQKATTKTEDKARYIS